MHVSPGEVTRRFSGQGAPRSAGPLPALAEIDIGDAHLAPLILLRDGGDVGEKAA
jgi:hypothetical protein